MQNHNDQQITAQQLQQYANSIRDSIQHVGGCHVQDININHQYNQISIAFFNQKGVYICPTFFKSNDGKWNIIAENTKEQSFANFNEALIYFNNCINDEWKESKSVDEYCGRRVIDILSSANYTVEQNSFLMTNNKIVLSAISPVGGKIKIDLSINEDGKYELLELGTLESRTFETLNSALQSLRDQLRNTRWMYNGIPPVNVNNNAANIQINNYNQANYQVAPN